MNILRQETIEGYLGNYYIFANNMQKKKCDTPPNLGPDTPTCQALFGAANLVSHKSARKRFPIQKPCCTEVYYTSALILLVNIMLCGKLDCIRVSKLKIFSYESLKPTL